MTGTGKVILRKDYGKIGPLEQGRQRGRQPRLSSQSFLSVCPFFLRALEVTFLKEVTKNVHENQYSMRVN